MAIIPEILTTIIPEKILTTTTDRIGNARHGRPHAGETQRSIARSYNVSQATISRLGQ
jgi:DNA-binding transcriptional regulator LsrR (DeoR family)